MKLMGKKQHLKIFFKGIAMGLADIVPGVSGGTVALILGIYERLIRGISSIKPETIKNTLKREKNGIDVKLISWVHLKGKKQTRSRGRNNTI